MAGIWDPRDDDVVESPGDITLSTYQAAATEYLERGPAKPAPAFVAFLESFAATVGPGAHVLELGSGPGLDAKRLEGLGVHVDRTDGTPAFVAMMQRDGHRARLLDVRSDDLGGPYDGILANAVLLHLERAELADFLSRARFAVRAGGTLAFTVKEGDGEGWSNEKLDLPRYFVYWRESPLREVVERAGWTVTSIDHVEGRVNQWLDVLATPDALAPPTPPATEWGHERRRGRRGVDAGSTS